jgi:hypothetical protein
MNEDINELNLFKKRLANITNYYDFCTINPYMIDNYNFYDLIHYRPHIGDMIISRLKHYPDRNVPDWFGIKVTKKNVYKYTNELKKQIDYYNKTKKIKTISQSNII